MKQTIELAQKQILRLTPALQISLKILQLPLLQLLYRIEEELTENPLLEKDEESQEDETFISEKVDDEVDWNSQLEGMEEEDLNYEGTIPYKISLREYLLSQLYLLKLNRKEREIGEAIIDGINEDGYLVLQVSSIAKMYKVKTEEVEKILSYIQEFEPVGIGARDLKEALMIQAKYLGWDENGNLFKLIRDHLEDIQSKNYTKIEKLLGIGVEEVKKLAEKLKILEPKPGRLYYNEDPSYIIPDVIVRSVDENFIVELNDTWIPKLRISPYYRELLKGEKDKEVLSYIKEKLEAASWFLKCIEERRRTILCVAEEIFKRQTYFLKSGPSYLQPLKMQDVASTLRINESTVSRAVSNKYAQTPWGIFPLKFFFSTALPTNGDGMASSHRIKERIKALIKEESPKAPLTDQEIVLRLNAEGFKVARRTVAKYRVAMGILPSNLRRR
jgi:RNA polymerase sigma-54 factor